MGATCQPFPHLLFSQLISPDKDGLFGKVARKDLSCCSVKSEGLGKLLIERLVLWKTTMDAVTPHQPSPVGPHTHLLQFSVHSFLYYIHCH